jgi:hypothetical protein
MAPATQDQWRVCLDASVHYGTEEPDRVLDLNDQRRKADLYAERDHRSRGSSEKRRSSVEMARRSNAGMLH